MVSRSLVLGYHGCDLATARKIVTGQDNQIPSTNEYDWLGNGLYSWEDRHDRADRWAQAEAKKKDGKVKKPAVLGAIIDLGNCLNLIDSEHLDLVKAAHQAYLELCRISGLEPAQNKGRELRARYLDKAVFGTLHKLREEEKKQAFDTVRAFFLEGEPLYENARPPRPRSHSDLRPRSSSNCRIFPAARPRSQKSCAPQAVASHQTWCPSTATLDLWPARRSLVRRWDFELPQFGPVLRRLITQSELFTSPTGAAA